MSVYIIRRILLLLPLLFGITFMSFSLTRALPGDPVYNLAGERASPETLEKLRREIGSDKGFISQYIGYITLLMHGEMGRSYYSNRAVFDDIRSKFMNTMKLAATAMFIAIPCGMLAGFYAAVRRSSPADRLLSGAAVIGLSMPVFWTGLLLMLFFSLRLRMLPPSGTGDFRYLVLPALTLSLPAVASIARVTRTTVLEILPMPFIRTAIAKGISVRQVQAVHVLKNALIPIITVIGLDFGSYLNGAVLTETIFGWDGIGRFTMEGVMKRDYPVIMGCIITGTMIFVLVNLAVDIIYHMVDPRVRVRGSDR